MSLIGEILYRIEGDANSIVAELAKTNAILEDSNARTDKLAAALEQLTKAQDGTEKSSSKLSSAVRQTTEEIKKQEAQVRQLAKSQNVSLAVARSMLGVNSSLAKGTSDSASAAGKLGEAVDGTRKGTEKLSEASDALTGAQGKAADAADKHSEGQNKLGKATKGSNDNIRIMTTGLQALATAFGLIKMAEFTTNASQAYERAKVLATALQVIGANAGYSASQLNAAEESVRTYNVSIKDARDTLGIWIRMGLQLSDHIRLMRVAQDLAVSSGGSAEKAFQSLITAIMTQYPRMLRQFGIIVYQNQVYEKYARTVGKAATSLTELEKRQAFLNVILEYGQRVQGEYVKSMENASTMWRYLSSRIIPDFLYQIGERYSPIVTAATRVTYEFMDTASKGGALTKLIADLGAATLGFLGVLAVVKTLQIALPAIRTLFLGVAAAEGVAAAAAGPWGWIALGVGALAAALVHLTAQQSVNTDEILRSNSRLTNNYEILEKNVAKLKEYDGELSGNTEALKELSAAFPSAISKVDKFGNAISMNKKRLEELKDLIKLQLQANLIVLQEESDKAEKAQQKLADAANDTIDALKRFQDPQIFALMANAAGPAFAVIMDNFDRLKGKVQETVDAAVKGAADAAKKKEAVKKAVGIETWEKPDELSKQIKESRDTLVKWGITGLTANDQKRWDAAAEVIKKVEDQWKSYFQTLRENPESAKQDITKNLEFQKAAEERIKAYQTQASIAKETENQMDLFRKKARQESAKTAVEAMKKDASEEEKAEVSILAKRLKIIEEFGGKVEEAQKSLAEKGIISEAGKKEMEEGWRMVPEYLKKGLEREFEEERLKAKRLTLKRQLDVQTSINAIGKGELEAQLAQVDKKIIGLAEKYLETQPKEIKQKLDIAPEIKAVLPKVSLDRIQEGLLKYGPMVQAEMQRQKIPEAMFKPLMALMGLESTYKPTAVSPAGAKGLMQLMPGTAAGLGVKDIFDVGENIKGGLMYIKQMYDRYGDWELALIAYNAGPGVADAIKSGKRKTLPKETENYLAVLGPTFKGGGAAGGAPPTGDWSKVVSTNIELAKKGQEEQEKIQRTFAERRVAEMKKLGIELAQAEGKSKEGSLLQIEEETRKKLAKLDEAYLRNKAYFKPGEYEEERTKITQVEAAKRKKILEDADKAVHDARRGYLAEWVNITGTETEKAIFEANRWRDAQLEALKKLKIATSMSQDEYKALAATIEQIYKKKVEEATHVTIKMFDDMGSKFGDMMGQFLSGDKFDAKKWLQGFSQENISKIAKGMFDAWIGEKLKFEMKFQKNMMGEFLPWLSGATKKGGKLAGGSMADGLKDGTSKTKDVMEGVSKDTDKLTESALNLADKTEEGMSKASLKLVDSFSDLKDGTKGVEDGLTSMGDTGGNVFDSLQGLASGFWNTLKGIFSSISSMFSGGGGGGGGGGFLNFFSFSRTGGLVVPRAIRRAQAGELVPGSGYGDKVPYLLEPGEFINTKNTVNALGTDFFNNLNQMTAGYPQAASKITQPIGVQNSNSFSVSIPLTAISNQPVSFEDLKGDIEEAVIQTVRKHLG